MNYSSDSRTVTFCDFLSNFRKNTAKNTTQPENSPGLFNFLTFFCNSPGVTTVYWKCNQIMNNCTDGESKFSRVQMKRWFSIAWLDQSMIGGIWFPISIGCLFLVYLATTNRKDQNRKNTYVKSRFICTQENFDSPSVSDVCNT